MEDELKRQYDSTPYLDQSFADLDLGRLLGLARLFKLGPDRRVADDVRVLDLACASGEHIRRQAKRFPNVNFTGVDFSSHEIELGKKAVIESGTSNVELLTSDLREFEVAAGSYDLVLCHGAFSWVPDEVKDRIFEVARTALKPTGVAAIAYLTYPGWKQREAIRELLAHRVRNVEDPQERVQESALLLRLLRAGYEAQGDHAAAQSLLGIVKSMQGSSANVFLHDELGGIHDPCYFTQFVEWAGEWGLQYLAETDLGTMSLDGLPDEAHGLLQQIAPDFIESQQLIDFVVNRSGRCSLLVRSDAPLARELNVNSLAGLGFTTSLVRSAARLNRAEDESGANASPGYETQTGQSLRFDSGCSEVIVERLLEFSETPPTLEDLEACAEAAGHSRADVGPTLLRLVSRSYADPCWSVA